MQHPSHAFAQQEVFNYRLSRKDDAIVLFRHFIDLMRQQSCVSINYTLHLALIYEILNDEQLLTLFPRDYAIAPVLAGIAQENAVFTQLELYYSHNMQTVYDRLAESFICFKWLYGIDFQVDNTFWRACAVFLRKGGRTGYAAAYLIARRCRSAIYEEIVKLCQQFIETHYDSQLAAAEADYFISSITMLSYSIAFDRVFHVRIDLYERWPSFLNRQTKHAIAVLLARHYEAFHSDEVLGMLLKLLSDCYYGTLESVASIISPTREIYANLGKIDSLNDAHLQFLALVFAFHGFSEDSEGSIQSLIETGLFPRAERYNGFYEAFLMLCYMAAKEHRTPHSRSFFEHISGFILPVLCFNENAQLRYAAAVCYYEIDGRKLQSHPYFCSQLACDEIHCFDYCIQLASIVDRNERQWFFGYISAILEFYLQNAGKIAKYYGKPKSAAELVYTCSTLCKTTEDAKKLTGLCGVAAAHCNLPLLELLLQVEIESGMLEERFAFVEALSWAISEFASINGIQEAFAGYVAGFLQKNISFVCRFYFNDATLKEMRDDIRLNTLYLFLKLINAGYQSKFKASDEYTRILLLADQLYDYERVSTFVTGLTGSAAVFLKMVFLYVLKAYRNTISAYLCYYYCILLVNDYSNDQRGDVGSQVRYRAYTLFAALVLEDKAFLESFYKTSVYFALSRLHSFRLAAYKYLSEVLHANNADAEFNNKTGLSAYNDYLRSCYFDIAEPTEYYFQRSRRYMLKLSGKNQFACCISLFETKYPRHCIRALLYASALPNEDEFCIRKLLGNFAKCDVLQVIEQALNRPTGFDYHMVVASLHYLMDCDISSQMIEGLLQFSKLKQLPYAITKRCLMVFYTAAVTENKAAVKALLLLLGHRTAAARELAANALVAWMLYQSIHESIIARFCKYQWSEMCVQDIKTIRKQFAQEISIEL